MLPKTIIAAGALLSMAAAVPLQQLNKRDVTWETSTMWDVTTIDVTTTIWLGPGETPPAGAGGINKHGHHHKHKVTSHIRSTVTVQPASPSAPPAQSSPYVAPSPSSPAAPATTWSSPPPAESTPAAQPSPQPKPQPKPKPQPSSGGGNYPSNGLTGDAAAGTAYTGDFTWYQTGLGACGITSSPSDHIVAISEDLFDQYATANPNDNPVCGKTVTLTGADGTAYPATVVDRCTGCALSDLDLSEDFFNTVTNNGDGRVSGMHWVWD